MKTLLTNAGWSAAAHLLERGSLVLVSIILSRMLDTAGFAAYGYFQMTVSMLAAYAAMGLGVTSSKFFAESDQLSPGAMPPLGTLWVLSVLSGLLLALVILLVPSSWIESGLNVPSWLLATGVFVLSLGVTPGGGILGLERYVEATWASAASSITVVGGALIAGSYASPQAAMVVFIFASFVQASINSWIVARAIGLQRLFVSMSIRRADLRKVFHLAGPMVTVTLLASSGTWLVGRILLSVPSGEHQFSLYVIGLQWLALVLYLPGMITRVIFPQLVKARLDENSIERSQTSVLLRQGMLLTSTAALSICCIAILLSPWLMDLYGAQYTSYRWLIVWFMLAALPMAPAGTLGNGIIANNSQWAWLFITAVWFVSLITLTYSQKHFGAPGAAISYGCAALIQTVLAYLVARRRGLIRD
jgi:O-antigen/teichoic acid export membrane protein